MSHFQKLGIKITDQECILKTIEALGYQSKVDGEVRGYSGNKVKAAVVMVLPGDYDIGFHLDEEGTIEFDKWGVNKLQGTTCDVLLGQIESKYAEVKTAFEKQKAGLKNANVNVTVSV